MPTVKLLIDDWDDRSGSPQPGPQSFGFVYFNDDSRVGYAPAVVEGMPVFAPRTNGGGKYVPVTQKHFDMACDFLREKGIL